MITQLSDVDSWKRYKNATEYKYTHILLCIYIVHAPFRVSTLQWSLCTHCLHAICRFTVLMYLTYTRLSVGSETLISQRAKVPLCSYIACKKNMHAYLIGIMCYIMIIIISTYCVYFQCKPSEFTTCNAWGSDYRHLDISESGATRERFGHQVEQHRGSRLCSHGGCRPLTSSLHHTARRQVLYNSLMPTFLVDITCSIYILY